jgi:RimJ/RimL family protein N-acetyltransferase
MEKLNTPVPCGVLDLLSSMSNTLTARAVGEGTCPGTVWADNAAQPTAAWVQSVEGCFLLGDPDDDRARRFAANGVVGDLLPAAEAAGWWQVFVGVEPAAWGAVLEEALAPTVPVPRRTFDFAHPDPGNGEVPPVLKGYTLRPIDAEFLSDESLGNTEHIRSWVAGNWGSTDLFLERGAGMCTVCDGAAASWSVADCSSGDRVEIGIQTDAAHRRRGLGTLTASATVAQCAERGFRRVGWHCPSYNLASAATARRAGFRQAGEHAALDVWFRPLDACLAHGAACLMDREPAHAAEYYARARHLADSGHASYLLDQPGGLKRHWDRAGCARALVEGEPGARERLDAAIERSGCRYYAV